MTFISYAQNFEDVMLKRALSDVEKGFYIDVGANDPEGDSMTKAFYDAGWSGINIEPMQQYFDDIVEKRMRDTNLHMLVGTHKGKKTFYEVADTGLSTTIKEFASKAKEVGRDFTERKIESRNLSDICKEHALGKDIHFMKIDVEGGEEDVIKSNDWSKFRPWILVVEATRPQSQDLNYSEWEDILLKHDYLYAYFDGLNRFYVSREHAALKEKFEVPPNFFDDFISFTNASKAEIMMQQNSSNQSIKATQQVSESLERKNALLKKELHQQKLQVESMESVIENLNKQKNLMINSRSWAVTKPLRAIIDLIKRVVSKPRMILNYVRNLSFVTKARNTAGSIFVPLMRKLKIYIGIMLANLNASGAIKKIATRLETRAPLIVKVFSFLSAKLTAFVSDVYSVEDKALVKPKSPSSVKVVSSPKNKTTYKKRKAGNGEHTAHVDAVVEGELHNILHLVSIFKNQRGV